MDAARHRARFPPAHPLSGGGKTDPPPQFSSGDRGGL